MYADTNNYSHIFAITGLSILVGWGVSHILDEKHLLPSSVCLVIGCVALFNAMVRLVSDFDSIVQYFFGGDLRKLLPGIVRIMVERSEIEGHLLFLISIISFVVMFHGAFGSSFALDDGVANGYIPEFLLGILQPITYLFKKFSILQVQVFFGTFEISHFCRLVYLAIKDSHWIAKH